MHGLIFETSVCYWQNQPGYLSRDTNTTVTLHCELLKTIFVMRSSGIHSLRSLRLAFGVRAHGLTILSVILCDQSLFSV